MKKIVIATSLFLSMGLATEAMAWDWGSPFSRGPWRGSGGNFATGSPRSLGITCTSCHLGSQNIPPNERISVQVTTRRDNGGSLVADDIFANGYQPGARYKVTVTLMGEHRGRQPSNGSYENPMGTAEKVACPRVAENRNLMSAEVMSEGNQYANYAGSPQAGILQPDSDNNPGSTAAGACNSGSELCSFGATYPPAILQGGPTTMSLHRWRLSDPNSNPPFGQWTCDQSCDTIVANVGGDITPDAGQAFNNVQWHFFWQAPNPAPSVGNGRIRFYIAAVDGDGYSDTYDDDVAEFRRAACPQGVGACNPTNPPWNSTEIPPVVTTPKGPQPPPMWLLATLAALIASVILLFRSRRARAIALAASGAMFLAFFAGCVNVKAWERGRMATAVMTRGPDIEEAMVERTFLESREASSGGSAAGAGGGCACN
ncbi:MAG: DUF4266 domain-containing protein [Deltaproteobacteria bacterium]